MAREPHSSAGATTPTRTSASARTRRLPAEIEDAAETDLNNIVKKTIIAVSAVGGVVLAFFVVWNIWQGVSTPSSAGGGASWDIAHFFSTPSPNGAGARAQAYNSPVAQPHPCSGTMQYAYAKDGALQPINLEGCNSLVEVVQGQVQLEDELGRVAEIWSAGASVPEQENNRVEVVYARFLTPDSVLKYKLCYNQVADRPTSWQCP